MAVRFTSNNMASSCCSFAAVCSSVRIHPLLDTAAALVVSISVLIPLCF